LPPAIYKVLVPACRTCANVVRVCVRYCCCAQTCQKTCARTNLSPTAHASMANATLISHCTTTDQKCRGGVGEERTLCNSFWRQYGDERR
jgi:hypothetical protein